MPVLAGRVCIPLIGVLLVSPPLFAASAEECRDLFLHGKYEECIDAAEKQIKGNDHQEDFPEVKARAELALGRYDDAWKTLRSGLARNNVSIRLRWQLVRMAPFAGHENDRQRIESEIDVLVRNAAWRYSQGAENLVTLAWFALEQGADPKEVQSVMLQRARKLDPENRVPVLAMGQLALNKRDFALAADIFRPAWETWPDDPEIALGLARALESSDPRRAEGFLRKALQENPRHVDAILIGAEKRIDGEEYDLAVEQIQKALDVNPLHPRALALLSVVQTLRGEKEPAAETRKKALGTWKTNPEVDHLIGKKLSQKYRFEEGAAAQRQALSFQPDYLPALKQLAQDLLRLGEEEEGWKIADQAYQQDQYDVASYNLVTLREEIERFTTLEQDGFRVRMDAHEAEVYGPRVLALLAQARKNLCPKYDVELPETILVEIFPRPADFAVRTFGMPAAGGYLGVCFGDVITANSPASQETQPVNWESVLWHEFTHVVTLNKTHNRMPRWLSEGISVYEERQHDPAWGQRMTPAFRKMIVDGELTPIHQLSSAFLAPPSPQHLMFAYYESSLVVEHIIENYGDDALLAMLDDLAIGMEINETIARHTVPLPQLEKEFAESVKRKRLQYGWYVDWSPVELTRLLQRPDAAEALLDWANHHPRNYVGLKTCGELLLKLNRPLDALRLFQQAVFLFPNEAGSDSALAQLAQLQQQFGQKDEERKTLEQLVAIDDAAPQALLRLIELDTAAEDWKQVRKRALQLLAVKPLISQPHAALARAAEELNEPDQAIRSLRSWMQLRPADIAGLHYRLAVQLRKTGEREEARRQILMALEQAPRFRAALSLLLDLQDDNPQVVVPRESRDAN
jgi:tetratricopeptide (TPR) repeat protein